MRRRDHGGWWIFLVMMGTAVGMVPLMAWIGLGVEAARGVEGWEWRLEGIRRVREAVAGIEAGHGVDLPDFGPVSVEVEARSGADPAGGRVRVCWAGERGWVVLMADFSGDFSDNVRLHDPEILAIPGGESSREAGDRWGRAREERLQQRDERILAWRSLARDGMRTGDFPAAAGSDPGFLRWLAVSFRPGEPTKDAISERGREGSSDRGLEDGDADEVEGDPSGDPLRAGPGG